MTLIQFLIHFNNNTLLPLFSKPLCEETFNKNCVISNQAVVLSNDAKSVEIELHFIWDA